MVMGGARWSVARRVTRIGISALASRRERIPRLARSRRQRLRLTRARLASWLARWGTFRRCPVAGPHHVADNYGIAVRIAGVPVHTHMGNDITAMAGTPVVAPFDGVASAGRSALGGLEVRVQGTEGYVYNAHLSSVGKLGPVHVGDAIGYVGASGDATEPHDHFEWHPMGGSAVDPNPLLSVVC